MAAGDFVLFRPESNNEGLIERVEPQRHAVSRHPRSSADHRHQRRSTADRRQRRRAPSEAQSDRSVPRQCRQGRRAAADLRQQDRSGRSGLACSRWWVCTARWATSAAVVGRDRLRRRAAPSRVGRPRPTWLSAKVASASRRCSMPSIRTCNCAVGDGQRRNAKGRHTTTTARLLPLSGGGYVVDTPGIRQFQLWDVIPEEVAGFFRDLRPYVDRCKFPDCTHTHEDRLRGQRRRGRWPVRPATLRKLLPFVRRRNGVT